MRGHVGAEAHEYSNSCYETCELMFVFRTCYVVQRAVILRRSCLVWDRSVKFLAAANPERR